MTDSPFWTTVLNNKGNIVVRKHNYRDVGDIELFEYDAYDRIKSWRYLNVDGVIQRESIYSCEYNDKGDILRKDILYRSFAPFLLQHEHTSVSHYINEYDEFGKKIKKTCRASNGSIMYVTEYLYDCNNLTEKRMYNDHYGGEYRLQYIEYFDYTVKNTILKTVKLYNEIISYHMLYFLDDKGVIATKMLNPEKKHSRWKIKYAEKYAENDEIGIDLLDDVLFPHTLEEILGHTLNICKYKHIYINEVQTDRFMYADNEKIISKYSEKYGMSIQFVF